MRSLLEENKVSLTLNGGVDIIELRQKKTLLDGFVGFFRHQCFRQQTFSEYGSRFGKGQSGMEGKDGMIRCHHGMYGMAQFVGQSSYISSLTGVIEKNIRRESGGDAVAERPAEFARNHPS